MGQIFTHSKFHREFQDNGEDQVASKTLGGKLPVVIFKKSHLKDINHLYFWNFHVAVALGSFSADLH